MVGSTFITSNFILAFVVTPKPHFINFRAKLGPSICPSMRILTGSVPLKIKSSRLVSDVKSLNPILLLLTLKLKP